MIAHFKFNFLIAQRDHEITPDLQTAIIPLKQHRLHSQNLFKNSEIEILMKYCRPFYLSCSPTECCENARRIFVT